LPATPTFLCRKTEPLNPFGRFQILKVPLACAANGENCETVDSRTDDFLRRSPGVEEPAFGALDCKRSQHPASISACIDADTIGADLHLGPDRMAVDDDEAMVGIIKQERLSNPAQVRLTLLVNFHAWPDPSVDEQIVAEAAAVVEALEKSHMLLGNGATNYLERIDVAEPSQPVRIDTVAFKALSPAETAPFGDEVGVSGKDSKQDLLMVAEEEYGPDAGMLIGPQTFDHLRRIGPAIDEVADEDEKTLALRARRDVVLDFPEKRIEKIEPTVHVTNGIGAPPAWAGRAALPSRRDAEHPGHELKCSWPAKFAPAGIDNDPFAKVLLNL
jgi:hypothetical protein